MESPDDQAAVILRARAAPAVCLILDYDGTLVPFAATPDLAPPDDALLALLRGLAARARVHVVSGRSHEDLERWFGDLPIGLHAEHGFWSRPSAASGWKAVEPARAPWKDALRPILLTFTARTAGTFLEEKTSALCLHYRAADPALAAAAVLVLHAALHELLEVHDLELLMGAKVVELRSRGVHKGIVVPAILASVPPGALIIAVGDDRTDEDLFAALPDEALAIHVGPGSSRAAHGLPDPASVRRFLASFLWA